MGIIYVATPNGLFVSAKGAKAKNPEKKCCDINILKIFYVDGNKIYVRAEGKEGFLILEWGKDVKLTTQDFSIMESNAYGSMNSNYGQYTLPGIGLFTFIYYNSILMETQEQRKHILNNIADSSRNGTPEVRAGSTADLAFLYYHLEKYNLALEQCEKAIETINKNKDKIGLQKLERFKRRILDVLDGIEQIKPEQCSIELINKLKYQLLPKTLLPKTTKTVKKPHDTK